MEGGNEGGRKVTPTSISIFDFYGIKTLWFEFGNDIFTGSKMPTLSSWRSSISLHKVAEKKDISTLKSWHFEASENIITKFKLQGLYTINIKYWNANWSGFPPSLIHALQNIGILHHKKEKLLILLQQSVWGQIFR